VCKIPILCTLFELLNPLAPKGYTDLCSIKVNKNSILPMYKWHTWPPLPLFVRFPGLPWLRSWRLLLGVFSGSCGEDPSEHKNNGIFTSTWGVAEKQGAFLRTGIAIYTPLPHSTNTNLLLLYIGVTGTV
jgi:hypothetical protein